MTRSDASGVRLAGDQVVWVLRNLYTIKILPHSDATEESTKKYDPCNKPGGWLEGSRTTGASIQKDLSIFEPNAGELELFPHQKDHGHHLGLSLGPSWQ